MRIIHRTACALAALSFLTGAISAQDPRIAVFEAYNSARTYERVRPQRLPEILARQQLASYRARIVEIDGATSFLVLEQVQPNTGRDTSSQAYLLTKSAAGAWTLANRMVPDSIIKTLWTRRFDVSELAQPASCVIDGREVATRSALAIRRADSIDVTLYPF